MVPYETRFGFQELETEPLFALFFPALSCVCR